MWLFCFEYGTRQVRPVTFQVLFFFIPSMYVEGMKNKSAWMKTGETINQSIERCLYNQHIPPMQAMKQQWQGKTPAPFGKEPWADTSAHPLWPVGVKRKWTWRKGQWGSQWDWTQWPVMLFYVASCVTEMQLWLVMVCRWSWTQLLMMSELGSPTPDSSSFLSSHWPDSRGRCSPVTTVYDVAEKRTFKNSVQTSTLPQTVSCAWLSSARDTCSITFSLLPSTDTLLVSKGATGQLQSASHPKDLPALPAAILQEQIACKVLVSSKCDCNLV